MSKRRLIYYSDARHYHMYCYEPPMRLEDMWAPIDEVAGTSVETFVWGFGVGPTMFHNTKVGEIWGTRHKTLNNVADWRAYECIMSLVNRGLDPLDVMIDRAHEKGMEFWGSLRLTHSMNPKVDSTHTWQFKLDHPEWCLKGPGKYALSWVHSEVRAERFALIEETVNNYDMDGFEVDLAFDPDFFEPEEVAENRHIMTEFMRDVRRVAAEAAEMRGRPITLGARVLPLLSSTLDAGLDVAAWLKEGLLDFAVPNVYAHLQMDADFPFEWLVDLAQPAGCEVYPVLGSKLESAESGAPYAGLEHFRAAAAVYWGKGADGLYIPWFKWPPRTEERDILTEIADPDIVAEQPKRYVLPSRTSATDKYGYVAQLPIPLEVGREPPGHTICLTVADEPERARALLRLRLGQSTSHDSMTVSLNGRELPNESSRRTSHGYNYAWIEYPLERGLLRRGRNEVGVTLHSRPHNLTSQVVLEGVELRVDYPKPAAV